MLSFMRCPAEERAFLPAPALPSPLFTFYFLLPVHPLPFLDLPGMGQEWAKAAAMEAQATALFGALEAGLAAEPRSLLQTCDLGAQAEELFRLVQSCPLSGLQAARARRLVR